MITKWLFLFLIVLALIIVGCADNDVTELDDEQVEEVLEEDPEEPDEEIDEDDIYPENDYMTVGETRETEGGLFTLKAVNYNVGKIDVNAATVDIHHIKAVSAAITGEMRDFLDQDEIEYISIKMTVENTSGDDITYFAGQAQLVTDTGEQLHSDIWLSDHIEGEMRAGVKQTGSLIYLLEQSKANEVGSVRIIIDSPMDENWNEIGDEIDIEVDL